MLACPSHSALELGSVTLRSPGSSVPTMSAKQGGALPGEMSSQHTQSWVWDHQAEVRDQSQGEASVIT